MSEFLNDKYEDFRNLPFEQAMIELEKKVRELERGQMNLDRAIELYQDGEFLYKQCSEKLAQARLKIEKIIQQDGQATRTEPTTYDTFSSKESR
ncbi:exodeoxyribonuclease VII small subunit [Rickettsiales endosymbiont of Peranema trichophorum]|uniref:exodeoxyribonuclease VII small subunit n=1 Tax=Rickettsiales endosymbiont of Peranema trichophorum TaxID=2486577 RepID=UPI001023591C|nr:exodeoxyribonuclease VII small subunit [Rickettsiales endosymbiont of Peranema trichophorum]RZI47658.1 exodeoxyribonuclease VII small subunit [Rickettsiales endosymbiont of Peranema trichophorum]